VTRKAKRSKAGKTYLSPRSPRPPRKKCFKKEPVGISYVGGSTETGFINLAPFAREKVFFISGLYG
jgi:hypothetical protein